MVYVRPGTNLLEAARSGGVRIPTECGGRGTCKKCLVWVGPTREPVLACQYQVGHDLDVYLPDQSQKDQILSTSCIAWPAGTCKRGLTGEKGHGLACDIGTTTVAASLIELATGRELATAAQLNPQVAYGADVISRINNATTERGKEELQAAVIGCINELINQLTGQIGVDPATIKRLCVVGNTTMTHLFLKLPVAQLGQAPYKAYSLDAHDVRADQLGIAIAPDGIVHVVEGIAGFVGADTTAVGLAVGIDQARTPTLVLDVGTNGELLLAVDGQVSAASCAAGPAFEGASITHGSRAISGAIERVWITDNDIAFAVIDHRPASSICGSGLVDIVACLLKLGLLDRTGRLIGPQHRPTDLHQNLAKRLILYQGLPAFVLAYANGRPSVLVTQADIRQVQLAKAAIRAGTEVLLKSAGIASSSITQVILAGAFGHYVSVGSAVEIGLLPRVNPCLVKAVGNAALTGARMILASPDCMAKAGILARSIRYLELATDPLFHKAFTSAMAFGQDLV